MIKSRYTLFIENAAQDLFCLVFFCILLSVYRGAFLIAFQSTLEAGTPLQDIWLAMWYGFRLSLKTAGAMTLVPFVIGTLGQVAWPKWPAAKVRLGWGILGCLVFAILFQTRLPYYQEFQNAFSPFIFNTFHDDVGSIVQTAITQYGAVWRVLWGLCCAGVTGVLFGVGVAFVKKWVRPLSEMPYKKWLVIGLAILIVPFAIFLRFGGSFNYRHSIYWKNATRLNQHLLNEAIFDDVQALYKARKMYKHIAVVKHISSEEVRQAALRLTGKELGNSLLPALTRTAQGAKIDKPSHIFVIVAETYMLWPLLDDYKNLPIANGVRGLLAQPGALWMDKFISASNGTMFGLTSVLLGLPELNLFTAYRPTSLEPYETSLAVQLKKQGYKTHFFYGGYPSWNGLGEFIQHQGFDTSFYAVDLGSEGGVWGIEDKNLLEGVEKYTTDDPTFTMVLTVTNHPPYTVNMTREPAVTPAAQMAQFVPAGVDQKAMVERLQHFEYADHYLAKFVRDMQQKYPDSLFVITGDHADRWTLRPNPSRYERLAVPLILIGKGISPSMLAPHTAAAHMDIVPTVMELILPKGTVYYALGKDILAKEESSRPAVGLHAYYLMTPDIIAEADSDAYERLPKGQDPAPGSLQTVKNTAKDIQTLAAWRIQNGVELE